ncbi:hypothetical protein HanRHA438_Chr05g0212661 [Helianthus annuus]|nr:hypothetical protein HanRHA438_Chr05g0212661 [Helianthus annuus]
MKRCIGRLLLFFLTFNKSILSTLGHPLDKRSTPRVTRVIHHQLRAKPGNSFIHRHDDKLPVCHCPPVSHSFFCFK